MGNRVLEIVVLLMSHIREQQGQLENFDDITSYLKSNGYTENEISSAYSWVLDQLQTDSEIIINETRSQNSFRLITENERKHFTTAALGYLLQLRHLGLLGDGQLELILDRGTYLGPTLINVDQIKIIVESVLFNETDFIEVGRQRVYIIPNEDGQVN